MRNRENRCQHLYQSKKKLWRLCSHNSRWPLITFKIYRSVSESDETMKRSLLYLWTQHHFAKHLYVSFLLAFNLPFSLFLVSRASRRTEWSFYHDWYSAHHIHIHQQRCRAWDKICCWADKVWIQRNGKSCCCGHVSFIFLLCSTLTCVFTESAVSVLLTFVSISSQLDSNRPCYPKTISVVLFVNCQTQDVMSTNEGLWEMRGVKPRR